MKLNIGETIKKLRRERDITQEELGDILGVSYQSISRWENGACYPDMELLPSISDFFGVSVDTLLCVNKKIEQEKVEQYLNRFQKAICLGKICECISIAREGVSEYPNNFVLLNKLMYALFVAGDNDGNIPEWEENREKYDAEITALGERIIKYCPDQDIRLEATARLAFNHCEMGRIDIGRKIYETLPSVEFCRENQIWWSLHGDEKHSFLKSKIKKDYESLRSSIWLLASSGCVSDEESIAVYNKVFELEKIVYDDGVTPDGWGASRLPFEMARLYARLGNATEAIGYLKIARSAAKSFDLWPENQLFYSTLLGEVVADRTQFETSDTRTLCEIMRNKWLTSSAFDELRNTDEFRKIIDSLS